MTNGATYFNVKFPNSRCIVRIPEYRINHQIKLIEKGRGVIPNYEIKETVESYMNGEDLVLEKVLEVIGQSK